MNKYAFMKEFPIGCRVYVKKIEELTADDLKKLKEAGCTPIVFRKENDSRIRKVRGYEAYEKPGQYDVMIAEGMRLFPFEVKRVEDE